MNTPLAICSFNMHGFNNGFHYLQELTAVHDIIFIQEHWLMKDDLCKINKLNDKFIFYGKSAMEDKCASGVLVGRPFGGVGVLVNKCLDSCVKLCGVDDNGRVIAIRFTCNGKLIVCFGLYFPCFDNKNNYIEKLLDIMGFISSVLDQYPGSIPILLGDFNFQIDRNNCGFREFDIFAKSLNLVCCDDLDMNNIGYTYCHETLGLKSLIDHVFVNLHFKKYINNYTIILDGAHLSDHNAVSFCISCNMSKSPISDIGRKK